MTTIVPDRFPNTVIDYYHKSENAGITGYKVVNAMNSLTFTTAALSANTLYAFPFVIPSGATVNEVAIFATTITTPTNIRLGIYDNVSDNTLYPSGAVWKSSQLSTAATGKLTDTPTELYLERGKLYWGTIVTDTNFTVRAVGLASLWPIYGTDNNFGTSQSVGVSYSFTYGTLPDNFAAGATETVTAQTALGMKLTN